jgi:hypothetical protein
MFEALRRDAERDRFERGEDLETQSRAGPVDGVFLAPFFVNVFLSEINWRNVLFLKSSVIKDGGGEVGESELARIGKTLVIGDAQFDPALDRG